MLHNLNFYTLVTIATGWKITLTSKNAQPPMDNWIAHRLMRASSLIQRRASLPSRTHTQIRRDRKNELKTFFVGGENSQSIKDAATTLFVA